jgi:hypothetical protein
MTENHNIMIHISEQFEILLEGMTLITILQKKCVKLSQNITNYSTSSPVRGSTWVHPLLPFTSKYQSMDHGLAE